MTRGPAGRRPPVPATLYSAELLATFAAGEHEAFVAAGGRPLRPRLARSLALADIRPGLRVVDVACGRGEALAHASRRGARAVGVDFSLPGLSITRETVAAVAAGAFASVAAADATRLPLSSGCADRVLFLDIAEHLHDWQLARALGELRRILAPGGYVVIHTLPNRWALAAAYPLLRLWSRRLPVHVRSSYERAVHVNEQDPLTLRRTLAEAGLDCRVWVEEWTTRHAVSADPRVYPDRARAAGYPVLRRPEVRWAARAAMRTPARYLVANDIFALAWRRGDPAPPRGGRFAPLR
ncbi:MAG: class I SAM-dependent methyltransferase [Anaerolineae bacterium]